MQDTTAPVNKIIPFSMVDGPGSRTAVFLQGCNQTCLYCHNPETIRLCVACGTCVAACPSGALRLENGAVRYAIEACTLCDECIKACPHLSCPRIRQLTPRQTLALLEGHLPFIRGITVSGGECTLYADYMAELFKLVRAAGKTCFVDSNGQLPFAAMPRLTQAMDAAMLDLKSADDAEHRMLTGRPVASVLENIGYLATIDKLFEVRTVVVPGLLDNERTVRVGAAAIAPFKRIRYKLIRYRPLGVREGLVDAPTPDDAHMERLAALAHGAGVEDVVII